LRTGEVIEAGDASASYLYTWVPRIEGRTVDAPIPKIAIGEIETLRKVD